MKRNGELTSAARPGDRTPQDRGERLRLEDPADDAKRESLHLGGPTGEPRGTRDAEDEAAGGGESTNGDLQGKGHSHGVEASGKGGGKRCDLKQSGKEKPRLVSSGGHPGLRSDDQAGAAFPRSGAPGGGSLLWDAILSWRITDVLNGNFYKDKVTKIPVTHGAPTQFCAIQANLLLEETRALICSSIHNHAKKNLQCCQLLSVSKWDSHAGFFLDIDLAMTRSDGIQCQHIATNGDVCLLTSGAPVVSQLDVTGHIGIVVGVGRDILFQRSFRVLVSDVDTFQPGEIKYVSFLTNITKELETSKILSLRDERDTNAVKALLKLHKMVGKKCRTCPEFPHCKDEFSPANQLCLSKLKCLHQNNTEIIWAPPGSLKGYLAAMLEYSLPVRHKILITVPSASSLGDIMMDLKELSDSLNFNDVLVVTNAGQEGISRYENFFLRHQSQELYCCLVQCKSFKMMSSLLDLSKYYHIKCTDGASCAHCTKSGLLKFSVQSFKKKFVIILDQLFGCLAYLKNHASAFSLIGRDTISIKKLIDELENFKTLLDNENQREDYIAEAFGLVSDADINIIPVDSASTLARSLNKTRVSCIGLIESIKSSLQQPNLETRDEIDRFCIKHSRIIVTTLDCTWQLHGVENDMFDVLLVHGAAQIREDQLLASFVLPVRHTVLLGDHLHLQPSIQSMLCKEAGYGVSIFERLQQKVSENQMLKIQFRMHPSINQFPNSYFYEGNVKDGSNVISAKYNEFIPTTLPTYGFLEMSGTDLRQARKPYVTSAVIIMLVQDFFKGTTISDRKVNIGVICLSHDDSNKVREVLRFKKEINDLIRLEVKCINNLEEESFDVIILSLLVDDETELKHVEENNLNVALTSARHCLWMVGEQDVLFDTGGIWGSLVYDARSRFCIENVDLNTISDIMKQFGISDKDYCVYSNSTSVRKMPGQEFTWAERPYKTKMILAHVRNQRGEPDTCSFQSASGAVESLLKYRNAGLIPPQEFNWTFLLDDWKHEYETFASEHFGSEDNANRGEKRITTSLSLYKTNGVLASNEYGTKSQRFKIKDYGLMDKDDTKAVTAHLEKGGIMVGTFRISRNYFTLSPSDVYVYDQDKAIRHDKSGLAASHVAMMIGIGHRLTGPNRYSRHMVMQNSEGKLFGINGIGRVGKKTVKKLYWIEVDDEAEASSEQSWPPLLPPQPSKEGDY